jgi:outer membrane protein TolC
MTLTALLIAALIAPAAAAPISYEDALGEALRANASVLGAEADRASAEGSLQASRGTWDPTLTATLGQNLSVDQGRFQGLPYTSENTSLIWEGGLSQALPTGTSWSLDFNNYRSTSETVFELSGQEVTNEVAAAFSSRLTASLTQQILEGWRMSYNLQGVRAAQQGLSIAEASLRQTRQSVLASTARAYWDLYAAQRNLQTSQRAVEVAEEERRIVAAQVDAGNMAPVEVTRVEAALAQARINLIQAEMALATARDSLALLLARDPGADLEAATPPGGIPSAANIDLEQARAAALDGNPGLYIQRVSLENAELDLVAARHARLPTLALTGSFGLSGYEDQNDPTYGDALAELASADLRSRYVGANLSTPLGGRSERGAQSRAAGAVTRARLDLEAQERDVSRQVGELVRVIESARRKVELAELNLRLAEETLAAEKARQSVGRAIQRDVLEAQRARDAAETGLVSARVDYRKALVDLQALQGKL